MTLDELWRRVWFFFHRERFSAELDEEMRLHADLRAAWLREKEGASPEQAVLAARARFGNTTLLKEDSRDMWVARWLEDIFKDIHFALRQLRKAPGFTAVAVISVALGIGANAAIFTLINTLLLKPLPVRDPN